jgi:gamma-glutamyltranspeptidase / glutathione hydrolase
MKSCVKVPFQFLAFLKDGPLITSKMRLVLPVCLTLLGEFIMAGDRPAGVPNQTRSVVLATHGMVATSQPLAAQAGIRILQQNGNAIDAAVATAAVLNVVEPMSTGIGGDVFAMVYIAKTEELIGLNGSGRSGYAASIDFFTRQATNAMPTTGVHSVTIPGALDGWETLLKKYGTMSLAQVLQPAIQYAENGFPVSEIIALDWQHSVDLLKKHPHAARTYLIDGRAPRTGEIFTQPNLARTLKTVASFGISAFYRGEIAEKIVASLKELGGLLTREDFADHHSTWVKPVSATYRGVRLYELPPNGQGIATLEMLNILEGFNLQSLGHNSAEYLHLLIEAKKLAFADRDAYYADPEKAKVPVERLISKEYADKQRKRISPDKAARSVLPGLSEQSDTAYLTVVDKNRNCVSFINSLFHGFGSGIVAGDTGICLQNRGALFSLDPKHPNRLEAHKRPLHTIIPAMAFKNEKPWLIFGVMGGDMQPQGHVQVLINMVDFGMNVQLAGEVARFRDSEEGVALEAEINAEVRRKLIEKGHKIIWSVGEFGGYQAIMIDPNSGVLAGGSDPRKDGGAVGW